MVCTPSSYLLLFKYKSVDLSWYPVHGLYTLFLSFAVVHLKCILSLLFIEVIYYYSQLKKNSFAVLFKKVLIFFVLAVDVPYCCLLDKFCFLIYLI